MKLNIALRPEKIFLVVPPTGLYIREDRCQTPIDKLKTVAPRPPIDLLYMAGMINKHGIDCQITDYPVEGLDLDHLIADLARMNPDWVILSITTPGLDEDLKVITELKERFPSILFIAKGAHFNAYDYDIQTLKKCPALFAVMRGEYEEVLHNWLKAEQIDQVPGLTYRLNDVVHRNEGMGFVEDLNTLPFPPRNLVNNALYTRPDTEERQTTIVTSRGCPFKCTFCLSRMVSGTKIRMRSPQNILCELKDCIHNYDIHNFLFRSDTFTASKQWVHELCSLIKEDLPPIKWACNSRVDLFTEEIARDLKNAGCWMVAFGVESGNQESLNRMKKGIQLDQVKKALKICRKAGLKSSIYILLGLPWETKESFAQTKKFIRKIDPDFVEFFYVYPFPGSDLYEEMLKQNLVEKDYFPTSAYQEPAFQIPGFNSKELNQMRGDIWKSFYLRPGYICKKIGQDITHPHIIKNYIKFGLAQLKDFICKDQG